MANNYDTNFTVRDTGNGVKLTNENTQTFAEDDFVQVYNDTVQNLETLYKQYENTQESVEEILEEKPDAMAALHALVETQETEADYTLEEDSLTTDDLNAFLQIQQLDSKLDQIHRKIEQVRDQVESMQPVAEKLVEDSDDLAEIPEHNI